MPCSRSLLKRISKLEQRIEVLDKENNGLRSILAMWSRFGEDLDRLKESNKILAKSTADIAKRAKTA